MVLKVFPSYHHLSIAISITISTITILIDSQASVLATALRCPTSIPAISLIGCVIVSMVLRANVPHYNRGTKDSLAILNRPWRPRAWLSLANTPLEVLWHETICLTIPFISLSCRSRKPPIRIRNSLQNLLRLWVSYPWQWCDHTALNKSCLRAKSLISIPCIPTQVCTLLCTCLKMYVSCQSGGIGQRTFC